MDESRLWDEGRYLLIIQWVKRSESETSGTSHFRHLPAIAILQAPAIGLRARFGPRLSVMGSSSNDSSFRNGYGRVFKMIVKAGSGDFCYPTSILNIATGGLHEILEVFSF